MPQTQYRNPITGNYDFLVKGQPGVEPVPGIVTSQIGMRFHPIHQRDIYHSGVDFKTKITPDSNGQVPVYSMAKGTVVKNRLCSKWCR